MRGHLCVAGGTQSLRVQSGRGASRTVQSVNLSTAWQADKGETVATYARHLWLAYAKEYRAGDRRIHGIAPLFEDVDCRHCGEGVRCCAHAAFGMDRGSPGAVKISHVSLLARRRY